MVIFNSYVKLPEGRWSLGCCSASLLWFPEDDELPPTSNLCCPTRPWGRDPAAIAWRPAPFLKELGGTYMILHVRAASAKGNVPTTYGFLWYSGTSIYSILGSWKSHWPLIKQWLSGFYSCEMPYFHAGEWYTWYFLIFFCSLEYHQWWVFQQTTFDDWRLVVMWATQYTIPLHHPGMVDIHQAGDGLWHWVYPLVKQ